MVILIAKIELWYSCDHTFQKQVGCCRSDLSPEKTSGAMHFSFQLAVSDNTPTCAPTTAVGLPAMPPSRSQVVYEDDHIGIVFKPAGLTTIAPGRDDNVTPDGV
jgi:23S rRNA-/tRNA-specific pseudouridylate synthase